MSKKEEGKLRAKLFATNQPVRVPLLLTPVAPMQYFEEERQLGLWGMLWNNKMLWVMGFMMLMSWGMQFLADPESALFLIFFPSLTLNSSSDG